MIAPFEFYAVEEGGPRALAVPPGSTQFTDLYRGLDLGVYSALRTFKHNRFLYLESHLDRTVRSMVLLGWDYRFDRRRFREALHEVVSVSPADDVRVRFDILAQPAVRLGTPSRELIALQPFTPPPISLYERGVMVDFAPGLARHEPLAKTAEFAMRRPEIHLGPLTPQTPYEYLLTDPDGTILEGSGTNFWAVRDGIVYTAGANVLEGITRQIILSLLPELGLAYRLEPIHRDELQTLQEAAISGSSRALLPVVRIGRQMIGDGRPGPVTRRILSAYNRFLEANVKTAI